MIRRYDKMIEECKIKIENKINEILDKEIKKYEDNEFIKESLEELYAHLLLQLFLQTLPSCPSPSRWLQA